MEPKLDTLQEAIVYFSDPNNCREYVMARRWPNGVECPRCGGKKVSFLAKYNRWQCGSRHENRQFTIKTGTIFEDSPLGLDKWLCAMWQVVNCKNGVSSYEVHRAIGVTQKTAWFMDHRIRLALQENSFVKLGGPGSAPIEVDETFIGGKARNMHKSRKLRLQQQRNEMRNVDSTQSPRYYGKTVVLGMLERGGHARAQVVADRRLGNVQNFVREHAEKGATLHTDEFDNYKHFADEYEHKVINHLERYVDGQVHTQGIENFWSLLKRSLNGTYVSVEPFHLFRYVDEMAFRFNNRRNINDGDRFEIALRQIVGKRITWNQLTGKEHVSPSITN